MRERIDWIDVAKAIGISFVIMGHLHNPERVSAFIYAFHMPLFFFLSGMTFKKEKNFIDYLHKKIRTLLIPYFLFAIITYIFWLILGRHFGEDANTGIPIIKPLIGIFYSNAIDNWLAFNGPLWYLTCLFVVEIAYYFLSKVKKSICSAILILCGIVGYILSLTSFIRLPWSINVGLTAIVFYGFGNLFINGIEKISLRRIFNGILCILFGIICYITSQMNGLIDMNSNFYGNIILFYLGAVSGILAMINFSKLFTNSKILIFIGRNTLVILALHGIIGSVIKGVMVFVFHLKLNILNRNVMLNLVFTLITLLLSLPIILFINRYIPELTGKQRLSFIST
ncbi:acyltransferase family protein [Treponema vincentii]|jgi:acyltransferase 3|uniref:Acyltransferase n=1 Tax=Treponema vincentii ATCC 35580 TaxID=596324 RepID=C8PNG9_9SPIR|nr:acyltransferase family protein [Treponema vincentii]EEV21074.1 acyltransferase [Treponema vincentii ATCC 35580]UTC60844.1 acyltransferase family protein [Treponema vincentii]